MVGVALAVGAARVPIEPACQNNLVRRQFLTSEGGSGHGHGLVHLAAHAASDLFHQVLDGLWRRAGSAGPPFVAARHGIGGAVVSL